MTCHLLTILEVPIHHLTDWGTTSWCLAFACLALSIGITCFSNNIYEADHPLDKKILEWLLMIGVALGLLILPYELFRHFSSGKMTVIVFITLAVIGGFFIALPDEISFSYATWVSSRRIGGIVLIIGAFIGGVIDCICRNLSNHSIPVGLAALISFAAITLVIAKVLEQSNN
jgi:drug/metabolite transporter (DMT)-like permease